jgi:hypothetical protein
MRVVLIKGCTVEGAWVSYYKIIDATGVANDTFGNILRQIFQFFLVRSLV